MLRIGMLTSGGDCQALNAAMRGVVKGICNKRKDVEIYGFKDGCKGLIYSDFNMLTSRDFSGILTQGGTILGTSRQPFKLMRVPDKDGIDKVEAMKHTYHKLHLDCLVVLGGNGTHKTANLLREEGLNVVTLPKTIDNDLWGTDMTFGFQSAVDIATDTIDRIHTTATSHSRVFIIEVMGHKVGHVTLHAGIAGGADVILLPEIPYDIDKVIEAIDPRKDVDGFHPVNTGRMISGLPAYLPATPDGILELLRYYRIETAGKHCVVIGRSNIVGRPIANLLSQKGWDCTVTLCHSRTKNLAEVVRGGDIVIAALGKAEFVTADMIKPGAVVVDVGITRVPSDRTKSGWKLLGDVKFDEVAPECSYITPVPGGVGPMTIISLMKNTLKAARREVYK